jgi:outer membrane murein-binding lipoprotein Lpp
MSEPNAEWRAQVDQDRQTLVRITMRLETKVDEIRADAKATRRHVIAQTYVGARAPIPLVLSVISILACAAMASVMIAGCYRDGRSLSDDVIQTARAVP